MNRHYWAICAAILFVPLLLLATSVGGVQPNQHEHGKPAAKEPAKKAEHAKKRAPESLPSIPQPDARAAHVPSGYRVEVVLAHLTYPTSVEFDDAGAMYVAEGGYIYGDDVAPARILRLTSTGRTETVAEDLSGPITDLLWHDKRLYISHRGKISVLEQSGVRDLVTGLPSLGDHHNNQLTVGPDGKVYFGQGTATNSGVVGLDNFKGGWLAKYPDVCDIPAKDIRLNDQAFETADPLALLADKTHAGEEDQGGQGVDTSKGKEESHGDEGHGRKGSEKGAAAHAGHEAAQQPVKNREHSGHKPGAKKESAGHEEHSAQAKPAKSSGHEKHTAMGTAKDGGEHEGHATTKSNEHAGHDHQRPTKGSSGHEGHEPGATPAKASEHDGNTTKRSGEHAGHERAAASANGQAHAGHGQMPKLGHEGHQMVKSFPFAPFAKTPPDDGAIRGTVKASGTILRMNADGSDLEMFAWGLRNPFGLKWGPDGNLYASDNGYDERGSRPIAHAPDCIWSIKQDAWYGFPDYAGGIPVTDTRFQPEHGPAPKFLMRDHPNVERPLLSLTHHVGAAKIDFSPSERFGFKDQLFLALAGDMNPITGTHEERSGFEVMRIDPASGEAETFFKAKHDAQGPHGMEFVVTAGPRRPVDVRFSADGDALYVVDVGAMGIVSTAIGPSPRPFPRTGVIWRIVRDEESPAAKSPALRGRSLR